MLTVFVVYVVVSLTWSSFGAAGTTGTLYKVYADSLNVRSEPAKGAEVVGKLNSGDLVRVTKEAHGWMNVTNEHVTGWVAGYYLKKVSGAAVQTAAVTTASGGSKPSAAAAVSSRTSATVTANTLRVRSGPGLGYRVVTGVKKGDLLIVLESRDGWLKIRTGADEEGWVAADFVTLGSTSAGLAVTTASLTGGASSGSLRGKTIVVDPGHGGSDPGMIGTTYETVEKEINLSTSMYLAEELRARGAKVVMTRTSDNGKPSLAERAGLASASGASAFVSIHYNSSPKNTSGTLTFYYSEDKDEQLARAIETRLSKADTGIKSNGIAYGDYHVLRENAVPSALVELGFLTNERDEAQARTTSYQRKAAAAIADGLQDYWQ
ncbi:N-acetylmuramoyl-L-alanine amidase [Paenibacillus tarimensis]|uniref:N-acetylmuramoyl-L-alanine amidase n=1 Tax=Paenibacillus tarimensis TaxID=416012 RepID=UPI001F1CAB7E|nr:N-acetylmuramoyl-L-alanine amidase [Paenibacillus tarimensis]MCF2945718.1 N-acetylmuramoyl-L-alanine amidase [Paenibacillus tarimensis]